MSLWLLFKPKTGWETLRKRENKNYRSDQFLPNPTRYREFQKNSKKIEKLKYIVMASFLAKTGQERLRKIENKNYRSYQFLSGPLQRISKKIAKKFKKLKNTTMASFLAKTGWDKPKKGEN